MILIAEKLTLIIFSLILNYPWVFLAKFIILFSIEKYWLLTAVQSLETNRIIVIFVSGNFTILFFDAFVGVKLGETTSYPRKLSCLEGETMILVGETMILGGFFNSTMSLCSYSWTLEATIRGFL